MTQSTFPTTTPNWREAARRRTLFFVIAALLLGGLAAILVYQWQARLVAESVADTAVLVAAVDIPAGEPIQTSMVKTQRVPASVAPATRLTVPNQAVGQIARVNIQAGEVIVPDRLLGGTAGGPISARLPNNLWAVNVPISWFVEPPPQVGRGDRIEIAAYVPGTPLEQAGIIVTDVEMIGDSGESSLVLAVTVEQALALLHAHGNGFQLLVLLRPAGG